MKFFLALFISVQFIISCTGIEKGSGKEVDVFLPEDLQIELWAESPMFFNPTNIDVDAKGRLWITEAVNYRNFNNDSSKALHHPGGDRVVILEDTNADGTADVSKVFVQDRDLVAPLGIGVIDNKIYVSCSPNLIVYTDTNRDDKPDIKEKLLTGFGGFDHDHSLHALIGGPDGDLYFNVGNAGPHIVTDKDGWTLRSGSIYTGGTPYNQENKGNIKSDDGKVWVGGLALKFNSEGKKLRVLGHNFRNAYELFIDSKGDMWQNDNDDQVLTCRTTWLMERGNAGYFSSDGTRYWQADQRPGQDIFTAHWHQDDPGVMPAGDNYGAGSPTGVVINEGDGLGEKYRGMLLSADAGRNIIFGYLPERERSGYSLKNRQNLVTSLQEDNINYVWNDSTANSQKEKWFRPSDVAVGTDGAIYIADWYDPVVGGHQMKDGKGYGRIYRITAKGKKAVAPTIDLSSLKGQIEALKNPAVNVRHAAAVKIKQQGESALSEVEKLLQSQNPFHRYRALWLMPKMGERGKEKVLQLLKEGDEDTRIVAYRALRNTPGDILPIAAITVNDTSAFVRREVAISLEGISYNKAKPIILQLIRNYDGEDRWYLETLGQVLEGNESDIFAEMVNTYHPEKDRPELWDKRFTSLMWRLHPPEAVSYLVQIVNSAKVSAQQKKSALTALAFINTSNAAHAMATFVKNPDKEVSDDAKYWLSFRHGNNWFALIDWNKLSIDPDFERRLANMNVLKSKVLNASLPENEKRWSVSEMARDSIGAMMLLGMMADKSMPESLREHANHRIVQNENTTIKLQAAAYLKDSSSLDVALVAAMRPDVSSGKKLFSSNCATCHRFNGEGKSVGPELTGIGKKFDRNGLLDAIINPDAGVVFGYEPWLVQTRDGETYYGFLMSDGTTSITLKDVAGNMHVIKAIEISKRQKQNSSMMPAPGALKLTGQNVSDIAAYLQRE